MKLSLLALNILVYSVFAAPTATSEEVAAPAELAKRATLTDVANGYASLNGGTKGKQSFPGLNDVAGVVKTCL